MAFSLTNYQFSLGSHRDSNVIFIEFPNNSQLKNELRDELKVTWSATHKKWYCPDIPMYRKLLNIKPKSIEELVPEQIATINKPKYIAMAHKIILKGYSEHTLRNYLQEFFQFLITIKKHDADSFGSDKIKAYILYCIRDLKLKESTIHNRINAIRFYYEDVLGREGYMIPVPRPKKPSTLPKVLSKSELKKMFELTTNIKHKVILQLVYGMGLRVSEIVALKITDIDSKRMMVHLRCAKGKKDRYVPLPMSALDLIREYFRMYKPKDFLVEGMTGGPYTVRSVQAVFKTAMNKARIKKPIGIHGLRHSYATHLLEAGTDMSFIQKLLGHRDIKTTMIYAKIGERDIAKIESPLDSLSQFNH